MSQTRTSPLAAALLTILTVGAEIAMVAVPVLHYYNAIKDWEPFPSISTQISNIVVFVLIVVALAVLIVLTVKWFDDQQTSWRDLSLYTAAAAQLAVEGYLIGHFLLHMANLTYGWESEHGYGIGIVEVVVGVIAGLVAIALPTLPLSRVNRDIDLEQSIPTVLVLLAIVSTLAFTV